MTAISLITADIPLFDTLDRRFARLLCRLNTAEAETAVTIALTAALASRFSREGHACFDMAEGRAWLEKAGIPEILPAPKRWEQALVASGVVGNPSDYKPLIRDNRGRIYLYRYWSYQETIAGFIRDRLGTTFPVREERLKDGLLRLFAEATAEPEGCAAGDCLPAVAAFVVIRCGFGVISGGPGTGKTTTVAKILALLLEQAAPEGLRIALAAPTGKAAARLSNAVITAKKRLDCDPSIREAIPGEALTLHRLLGSRPGSIYFRHHADNRLPLDVVVVDEASMVDMALLAKLMAALPDQCRLLLVGDKDQLASVEAGSVFADICSAGSLDRFSPRFLQAIRAAGMPSAFSSAMVPEGEADAPVIDDSLVQLEKNYRFVADGGISRLSRAIQRGDGTATVAVLDDPQYPEVVCISPETDWRQGLWAETKAWFTGYFSETTDVGEAFRRLESFRILCALREGPCGTKAMNAVLEDRLKTEILGNPDKLWYSGRPVMVIRNDYQLQLFNGDVGIALKDKAGRLRVCFYDGTTLRWFHPRRLPECETVYAMTVHKSQGTEFDRVLLLLPETDAPVLSRELLYTAVTRARSSVSIVSRPDILQAAVLRRTFRMSGLREALAPASLH